MIVPVRMRENILRRIEKRVEALDKGYRQNIGLIGCEGLGKTYLLTSLYNSLKGQARFIPIYLDATFLDLDNLIEKWVGAMLSGVFISREVTPPSLFQSLLTAAEPIVPKTTEKIRHLKKMARREQNAATVRELFSLTAVLEQETGKKIILMIDEFQSLENLPAPDPFALLGKEIMVEKNTLYLVASSNPVKAKEIFREKLSLLFANFEVIETPPFSFEESSVFLDAKMIHRGLTVTQKKFMIRMTDGQPVYLQILLEQLETHMKSGSIFDPSGAEGISSEDLLRVFELELFNRNARIALMFENRIERCRRIAREGNFYIQALLALSHSRHQVVQIAAFMEKKIQDTKKMLNRLVEQDFVIRKGDFYLIQDPLFRFWLREVFQRRTHHYVPSDPLAREEFIKILRQEYQKEEQEEVVDITARLEALFKGFQNHVIEIDQKKNRYPHFSEIAFRPTNGRVFPLVAKAGNVRWFCQSARETIHEEDVALFVEELKRSRKKIQHKVMIALNGIDQNAKLMAQEAKVQIWDLKNFNELLDLYSLPKIIVVPDKELNGSPVGALAQSVHTA